ncbi:ABC transporter substrate-binding protein [Silvimonas amylolytica]|uniref:Sugar ABC transporter substrate-binding protein n=1 Tax=Silvimonas amylolytica TaxID=449663 RepID=A0ABQ2PM30_9NEIS|nr:sugar ABC transporter substrate-binding protein [Silvimonas amylolytica]GGP26522.1 sugar ABC transporter substrate-binding protein [Silvimonas amylolytica]
MKNQPFVASLTLLSTLAATLVMPTAWAGPYDGYTLRVKLIGGEQYEPLYSVIPEWEKKTGAKVQIVSSKSHFELDRELKQDIASGKIDYCLFSNHTNFAAQYVTITRDLKPLVPADFVSKFSPRVIQQSTIKGKLLEIPRHSDISELYYNKKAYDDPANKAAYKAKFGKDLAPPQTWDDVAQQAKFFAKPPNFYGTQFAGKDEAITGRFYEMLVANGGQLFDKNFKPTFNSPAGVKSLNWFVDLYKSGAVPKGAPNYVWDDLGNGFASGTVALDLDWGGWASFFNDPKSSKVAGNVGIIRAPKGSSGKRTGWSGSHSFSITQSCDNPKAAADFLMFITGFDAQMLEARRGLMPTRLDAQQAALAEFKAKNETYLTDVFNTFAAGMREDSFTPPLIPEWVEVSNSIWPELQKAIVGDKTSKQALDDAAKKVEALMDDAGYYK